MARAVPILGGLVVVGLGVWGAVAWWPQVVSFLQAGAVMLALLMGLTVIVFALSELKAPSPPTREEPIGVAPADTQGDG